MCAAALPGAGLVCIESRAEQDFLRATFGRVGEGCCRWPDPFIGDFGSDQSCCTWSGLFQDPSADSGFRGDAAAGWDLWRAGGCDSGFRAWSRGEPNQWGGLEEDCALLFGPGEGWVDIGCGGEYRCLCEVALARGPLDAAAPLLRAGHASASLGVGVAVGFALLAAAACLLGRARRKRAGGQGGAARVIELPTVVASPLVSPLVTSAATRAADGLSRCAQCGHASPSANNFCPLCGASTNLGLVPGAVVVQAAPEGGKQA